MFLKEKTPKNRIFGNLLEVQPLYINGLATLNLGEKSTYLLKPTRLNATYDSNEAIDRL